MCLAVSGVTTDGCCSHAGSLWCARHDSSVKVSGAGDQRTGRLTRLGVSSHSHSHTVMGRVLGNRYTLLVVLSGSAQFRLLPQTPTTQRITSKYGLPNGGCFKRDINRSSAIIFHVVNCHCSCMTNASPPPCG